MERLGFSIAEFAANEQMRLGQAARSPGEEETKFEPNRALTLPLEEALR